ncbi:MAG: D-galactose 1-dehydrogenase [Arenicella sp.]|jgi:D-galactose 1-dehydrogenase
MSNKVINLGIVGVGKIVRDQHLPSIAKKPGFNLSATASRNASVDGVRAFSDIASMLEVCDIDAVALCMPPQYRQAAAQLALKSGKHVLLEKPPGATVSEVEQLAELADKHGVSLFATWHSRYAAAVDVAKALLSEQRLKSVALVWQEDVRKWHPNQQWIWQAGGLGVFDPGINGLSILTHCLPSPAYVTNANLIFPANKAAPIAANINFKTADGVDISGQFDWRATGSEAWNIDFETDQGLLQIKDGGARLLLNNEDVAVAEHSEHGEYEAIYTRFADLIQRGVSDVELAPLKLVADAFLLANREEADAFND